MRSSESRRQGVYWLLTIPWSDFVPYLPPQCVWIKGQLERGNATGYCHWQITCAFNRKQSLRGVKSVFGTGIHAELSRSDAASEYVWKDDTAVTGTRFELGSRLIKRNDKRDWDKIWEFAKSGDLESIPSSVRIQSYRTIRAIASDFAKPVGIERVCYVFWGRSETGKSRRAWAEAGNDAYPKDPRTKFWCGYGNHSNVVIDEFRGG